MSHRTATGPAGPGWALETTWDEVSRYEDHYGRGWAIYEHADELPASEYWKGVADAWSDCDRQGLSKAQWRELWTGRFQGTRAEYVMTDQERTRLDSLPDRVRVHRGWWIAECDDGRLRGGEPSGMSWTLNEDLAHWFALRPGPGDRRWGQVISGFVRRERILALLMDRDEDEVVVLPKFVTGRQRASGDPERRDRHVQARGE